MTDMDAMKGEPRKTMNLMIGTPMGSDGPTWTYNYSLSRTLVNIQRIGGYGLNYLTTRNEITARARNSIAQAFLSSRFDKLMFIDSDMGWEPVDFFRILDSPHSIIAGIAPPKDYPITLNFIPFGEEQYLLKGGERPQPQDLSKMRASAGGPVFPVDLVGTAFMCIDRGVFMKLSETTPSYQYSSMLSGGIETHWDFFPQGPVNGIYYPEDWGFCRLAKAAGFKIHIDSEAILTHMGNHIYQVPKEDAGVPASVTK